MPKFESVQLDILNSNSKNQLVSAGAGSGKTTIMIEKIANLILKEKVPVESLLVVTFTVLAGEEMKSRLIEKLNNELQISGDKQSIISLINQVKMASIDTIDGFSSKTIKKYFYELNISPNIEIISDATRDYYLTRAMNLTIEKLSKETDKVNLILDFYGGNRRNFEPIKEMILNTYYNIINIENYDSFLQKSREEYLNSEYSDNIILKYIIKSCKNLKSEIIHMDRNLPKEILDKIDCMYAQICNLNTNLNLKSNLIALNNINIIEFSKKQVTEYPNLAKLNNAIKNFNKVKSKLQENGIDENFDIKNEKIIQYYDIFIEILTNFIKNYQNLKEKNNLIDFNDLNRLMLKLLKNERVKNELQSKYKYIFVDEYQDVNPLQDALLSSVVSKDSYLFTVGDVKQSIYAFRGSSPEWFLEKYNNYQKNPELGTKFDMNVNFRSNPKILNFINEIFSKLMTKESSGIDYIRDAMIEPKRDDIVDDKVKIILTKENKDKQLAKGVYSVKEHAKNIKDIVEDNESLLVINLITELIGTDFYDSKIKQIRSLKYSDIAILSRSEKDDSMQALIEMLKSHNIPVNSNNSLDIKNSEGVKLILSILKCVCNIADDVDYFATFMAITNMNIGDFISIRDTSKSLLCNLQEHINEKINVGFKNLENIKIASYTKTNSELIRYILNDIRLKYYFLVKPDGEKELQLIEEFLEKISTVEDNLNLTEFIKVVESNVSKNADFNSLDKVESVTIQTIHKSKGLEYPVVILFNASKQFNFINDNQAINFNKDIGLGLDYFDIENRTKSPSSVKYAIRLENMDKGFKEELRLLYVALTRAKNKLIITGEYNENLFDEDKTIKKNSFIGTILSCYENNLQEGENQFKYCDIAFVDEVFDTTKSKQESKKEIVLLGQDFEYKNREKFAIPLKNTVTGLNSQENERTKFDTRKQLRSEIQVLADEDRATIGTHYHTALEKLDFTKEYEKNTDFSDVDYTKIKRAHEIISPLTKNAIAIKKEADFMMYTSYNNLVKSEVTDKVLVQGVVDLIIEYDKNITIIDYKFSRLNAKTLKEKYLEQLNLYKMAVEKYFNKPVTKTLIYSIETGELV